MTEPKDFPAPEVNPPDDMDPDVKSGVPEEPDAIDVTVPAEDPE